MTEDNISKLIEETTNKRIAAALERIADALEKQNVGGTIEIDGNKVLTF